MDEDDGFGRAGNVEGDLTPISAARDQLFQSALNELEDGEFGAHWNSSLNEVYAEEGDPGRWARTEPVRPILHDIDMTGWHVATDRDDLGIGAVRSSSPSSFESEMDTLAQNQDTISRLRARVDSLTANMDSRLAPPRLPLVRRHSLRRSRFTRSPTGLDPESSLRRRLARGMGEDADDSLDRLHDDLLTRIGGPGWRPNARTNTEPSPSNLETLRAETVSSGAALRRLWAEYPVGSAVPGSTATLQGRRSLRRGGLRPPETLTSGRPTFLSNPYGTLRGSSSLSLNAASIHPRHSDELLPTREPDLVGRDWGPDPRTVVPHWNLVTGDHTVSAPSSPMPSDIRVRWTENHVPFPVTSEAAEHQSVSVYPDPPSATAVEGLDPEPSTLPQPDTPTQ